MNEERSILKPNIPILVMSLVLSLILWAIVTTQETAVNREISIALQFDGLNSSKFTFDKSPPTDYAVQVAGAADYLKSIANKSYRGYVDLSNVHQPGPHSFTIGLPADLREIAVNTFPKINLTIDSVETITKTVQTGTSGRLSDPNVILTERDALPHTVRITGPKEAVKQIESARVTIDLSKVHPDEPDYEGYIELYDANNNQLNQRTLGLTVEPPNSQVHLGFIAAPVEKPAFVFVTFKPGSQPNSGFRVGNYDVTPTMVTIKGTSLALASTTQVETEPIDLTGLTSNHQFTVNVVLPKGVSSTTPKLVKVRVAIVPLSRTPRT